MNGKKAPLSRILAHFRSFGHAVLTSKDIETEVRENREKFGLPASIGAKAVRDALLEANQLRVEDIAPVDSEYNPIRRFVLGTPSPFAVAVSISSGGYLSHSTALYVHGLSNQTPATIYVNREQSVKPRPTGALTQAAIDNAFRAPQRRSNYVFEYDNLKIAILSGRNTNRLEVINADNGEIAGLPVTSVERTLIDCIVRPDYAGGVGEVARAFEEAILRVSAKRLEATLRRLNYIYPYHQALGYYLERFNYPTHYFEPFLKMGVEFDFYLAHGMKNAAYNSTWRVFHPEWLK